MTTTECECEPDHSVTKLGHCRDCPGYKRDQVTLIEHELASSFGCPPGHVDGTPHDFEWATYADETQSYGVCRCGLGYMDFTLLVMP